jgi:hypothetical protein
MTRMKNALGAALLLIPFAAGATTTYTFDSLSKIQYGGGATLVTLTGILLGDSAPSTVAVPSGLTECEGFYKEALSTSGKFLLNLTTDLLPPSLPGGSSTLVLVSCSLERKH